MTPKIIQNIDQNFWYWGAFKESYKIRYCFRVDANAHGTSTPMGDEIEYNAIKEVVGNVPIVSNKSKIGHTFGACGIIEAIYTIKSLQSGKIPDNHNITKCSFDTHGMITNKNRTTTGKMALNNSFGFGGKCSSQLIEVV